MLFAIVSDLHANSVAWKAVLADLSAIKADRIICLGDVVGYGPDPAGVLESVYRHVDAFVIGNHDAVVAGKMSAETFNDHARRLVEWSAGRVSSKGRAFLGSQPLVLEAPGFVCTHGSLENPAAFNYILTPEEALGTFRATDRNLVFVGHTHLPGISVLGASGHPHMIPSQDFELEAGKRYIVNVGSVGDPRDEDPRASYCLYDDSGIVRFRRVAFDYAALAERVRESGLDVAEIPMLRRDPVPRREPVRETLGFAPPSAASGMASGIEERRSLAMLRRSNRRLRWALAGAALALSALCGALAGLASRPASEGFIPAKALPPVETLVSRDLMRSPLPPIPDAYGEIAPGSAIEGWRYSLADPARQHLAIVHEPSSSIPALEIRNDERLPFVLEAPLWVPNGLADGMRLQAVLLARCSGDFSGGAAIKACANPGMAGERVLLNEELLLTRPGTLQQTKRTMDKKSALRIQGGDRRIGFRIEATFSGTLLICDPRLVAVP